MNKALLSTGKNDWETPRDFFEELDKEFHFTLDPCASERNHKCKKILHGEGKRLNTGLEW